MAGCEAGKKRARIDADERSVSPVSPFVATPTTQHLAKILRVRRPCVRQERHERSSESSLAEEAPTSLESERTCEGADAETASPTDAALSAPDAPLITRRTLASVASLSLCRVPVERDETDASGCSTESGSRGVFLEGKTGEETDGRATRSMHSSSSAQEYFPGTKMPTNGWMQRCFGCGVWTGQAVRLGTFEVFRCNACARAFRERAVELQNEKSPLQCSLASGSGERGERGARGECETMRAHTRGLGWHRPVASSESRELTGLASRLRDFLLKHCPDRGVEHSISNRPSL
jgi:hypothetical protein